MNRLRSRLVLGFHGCDERIGRKLLDGQKFKSQPAPWHWLGQGVYFWERDRAGGREPAIRDSFIVGAIVDLGRCLDLSHSSSLRQLKLAHASLEDLLRMEGKPTPKNSGKDLANRALDCAVIDHLYLMLSDEERRSKTGVEKLTCDTVRGYFTEGAALFPGSEFRSKSHVRIAVRNTDCILGTSRVDERLFDYRLPSF